MPATITLVACGRPVGDLVGHRWLSGRSWPVIRVEEADDNTAVVFETGRAAWKAPWPAEWPADLEELS
jgi:hypothetical protein